MKYKAHRLEMRMTKDQDKLEPLLNSLKGELILVKERRCQASIQLPLRWFKPVRPPFSHRKEKPA
jgi:hypothetical protein